MLCINRKGDKRHIRADKGEHLQIKTSQEKTILDPQRNDIQLTCVLFFRPASKPSKRPLHVSYLLLLYITNNAFLVLQSVMQLIKHGYGATEDLI